jgi:hypothetical protein
MDHAQRELAAFAADWTAHGFALYEQGPDGVWRRTRDYFFDDEPPAAPTLPHQQSLRAASRL